MPAGSRRTRRWIVLGASFSATLARLAPRASDPAADARTGPSRVRNSTRDWEPPDLLLDDGEGEAEAGKKCRCVLCKEDERCGGLWKANRFPPLDDRDPRVRNIHVVVSHCERDLGWLRKYVEGYDLASVRVVTKCGRPVTGAPANATIEALPNVGRCDHSYARYLADVLDSEVERRGGGAGDGADDGGDGGGVVVVFLKDVPDNLHQARLSRRASFDALIRAASSDHGFACGVDVATDGRTKHSAYHEATTLFGFEMEKYIRPGGTGRDRVAFKSKYENLGAFYRAIAGDRPVPALAQVCYGGAFAASYRNVKRVDPKVWDRARKALERGDSVEEGHFMERLWGMLLATPLREYQADAIAEYSEGILREHNFRGMLTH